MSPVGFEPTISAGERLQIHALDRAATGTGELCFQKALAQTFDIVILNILAAIMNLIISHLYLIVANINVYCA